MRNINLNQFALPGMEEHAHPGARHLAKGVSFHTSTDYTYRPPAGSTDWRQHKQAYGHMLYASGKKGETLGELHWAGQAAHRPLGKPAGSGGHYPGEITWVESKRARTKANPTGAAYIPTKSGNWRKAPNPHKGLMTDMFHMAHGMQFGQSTVPVHSADRTREGEAWATKVGPAHLTPKRYDDDWRPPVGIHPFERQAHQAIVDHLAKRSRTEGQQHLFLPPA
jgi:hypothetical protein